MCFSTDDLIKVIGIEALAVCCEEVDDSQKFELPITHTGLFRATEKILIQYVRQTLLHSSPIITLIVSQACLRWFQRRCPTAQWRK